MISRHTQNNFWKEHRLAYFGEKEPDLSKGGNFENTSENLLGRYQRLERRLQEIAEQVGVLRKETEGKEPPSGSDSMAVTIYQKKVAELDRLRQEYFALEHSLSRPALSENARGMLERNGLLSLENAFGGKASNPKFLWMITYALEKHAEGKFDDAIAAYKEMQSFREYPLSLLRDNPHLKKLLDVAIEEKNVAQSRNSPQKESEKGEGRGEASNAIPRPERLVNYAGFSSLADATEAFERSSDTYRENQNSPESVHRLNIVFIEGQVAFLRQRIKDLQQTQEGSARRWQGETNAQRQVTLLQEELGLLEEVRDHLWSGRSYDKPFYTGKGREHPFLFTAELRRYRQLLRDPQGTLPKFDRRTLRRISASLRGTTGLQTIERRERFTGSLPNTYRDYLEKLGMDQYSVMGYLLREPPTIDYSQRFSEPRTQYYAPNISGSACTAFVAADACEFYTNAPPLSAGRLYGVQKVLDLLTAKYQKSGVTYETAFHRALTTLGTYHGNLSEVLQKELNITVPSMLSDGERVNFILSLEGKEIEGRKTIAGSYLSTAKDALMAAALPAETDFAHPKTFDVVPNSLRTYAPKDVRLSYLEVDRQKPRETLRLIQVLLAMGRPPIAQIDTEKRLNYGDTYILSDRTKESRAHVVTIVGWELSPEAVPPYATKPHLIVRDSYISGDQKQQFIHCRVPAEAFVKHIILLADIHVGRSEKR